MTTANLTGIGVSKWTDIDGPVHYLDFGGPSDGPAVVCVHGLGGSAINWDLLAPELTGTCRVLAVDLPGHGLTQAERRSTSVHANQHILHRFLTEVAGVPVVLIGNSMGGMLTVLQATSAPYTTAGVVMVSPALPAAGFVLSDLRTAIDFAVLATPGLGTLIVSAWNKLATAERQVMRTLRTVAQDPATISSDAVARAVHQAEIRREFVGTARHMVEAARSVVFVSQGHTYARRLRELDKPTLLIHGDRDRLVSARAARAAASKRPDWHLEVFEDVGHVAQLERPVMTARAILEWLEASPEIVEKARSARPLYTPR